VTSSNGSSWWDSGASAISWQQSAANRFRLDHGQLLMSNGPWITFIVKKWHSIRKNCCTAPFAHFFSFKSFYSSDISAIFYWIRAAEFMES